MRLTINTNSEYGYELKADNPNTSLAQDTAEAIQKLGQYEDIEDEFEIDNIEDLRDRLTTYKFLANHEMSCVDVNAYNLMLKDLDEYHSIEKELGIDLVTLINILRTGGHIWVKNCKGINEWHVESLKQRGLDKQWYLTYSNNVRVKLKDYGKTWALTKEELE